MLEGIALLRHCQNDILERLMREWKNQKWFNQNIENHLKALSATTFKGKEAQSASVKGSLYLKGASLKTSQPKDLSQGHPKNFYLKVHNQCGR